MVLPIKPMTGYRRIHGPLRNELPLSIGRILRSNGSVLVFDISHRCREDGIVRNLYGYWKSTHDSLYPVAFSDYC